MDRVFFVCFVGVNKDHREEPEKKPTGATAPVALTQMFAPGSPLPAGFVTSIRSASRKRYKREGKYVCTNPIVSPKCVLADKESIDAERGLRASRPTRSLPLRTFDTRRECEGNCKSLPSVHMEDIGRFLMTGPPRSAGDADARSWQRTSPSSRQLVTTPFGRVRQREEILLKQMEDQDFADPGVLFASLMAWTSQWWKIVDRASFLRLLNEHLYGLLGATDNIEQAQEWWTPLFASILTAHPRDLLSVEVGPMTVALWLKSKGVPDDALLLWLRQQVPYFEAMALTGGSINASKEAQLEVETNPSPWARQALLFRRWMEDAMKSPDGANRVAREIGRSNEPLLSRHPDRTPLQNAAGWMRFLGKIGLTKWAYPNRRPWVLEVMRRTLSRDELLAELAQPALVRAMGLPVPLYPVARTWVAQAAGLPTAPTVVLLFSGPRQTAECSPLPPADAHLADLGVERIANLLGLVPLLRSRSASDYTTCQPRSGPTAACYGRVLVDAVDSPLSRLSAGATSPRIDLWLKLPGLGQGPANRDTWDTFIKQGLGAAFPIWAPFWTASFRLQTAASRTNSPGQRCLILLFDRGSARASQ